MNNNTYTVHITSKTGTTIEKRTITRPSLSSVIQCAHGLIDFIWYDYPVSAKGLLTITDDTGSVCWTETITPTKNDHPRPPLFPRK